MAAAGVGAPEGSFTGRFARADSAAVTFMVAAVMPTAADDKEAALLAARRNKRLGTMSEFEEAKDKVLMGAERRSMVMTDAERQLTAYHEGGHALVTVHSPASDPIHKATIIPRGRALGMVRLTK